MFYTKVVLDIRSGKVITRVPYKWDGPVMLCKGPSAAEQAAQAAQANLATEETAFMQQLQADYSKQFASQRNILQSLTAAWSPILKAGPNQEGFSPAEISALDTTVQDTAASSFNAAQKATQNMIETRGGGNVVLPSGTEGQILGQEATAAASQEAAEKLAVKQKSFDVGRQNFLNAASVLSSTAGLYSPTSFSSSANSAAGVASSADSAAFNDAYKMAQQSGGFWSTVGGILGGAAGSFLGPLGTSVGS